MMSDPVETGGERPCSNRLQLLFVCSRNRRRSLTAELAFENDPRFDVRSAGTEPASRIRVTAGHVAWADVVFVMERKHADYLRSNFPDETSARPVINLRVPDEFEYGDPALIALLRDAVLAELDSCEG